MDFTMSERQRHWRDRVVAFMAKYVYPAIPVYEQQMESFGSNRWQVVPVLEALKKTAKSEGLWNLFLPPSPEHDEDDFHGAGLSNLEYAMCSEEMGKISFGSEVFNCSAPDTGNMEVLHRYGSRGQKKHGHAGAALWMRSPGAVDRREKPCRPRIGPNFVPVRRRLSRRTQSKGVSGSTSTA